MAERVTYEHDGSIATITMDDGKVNVLSPGMQSQLNDALDKAQTEASVIVLAGRDGRFSGGFDLGVLQAGGTPALDMLRGGFELAASLLASERPVVIACTGHAVAMGSLLLLAADYRVGADGPFKITANEVAIGLVMPTAAIELCRQRLAPAHLQRAVVTAEVYDPAGAVPAGFLDSIVPPDQVIAAATEVAGRFATLHPFAHAETKRCVRGESLRALHEAIEFDDAQLRAG